MHHTMNYFIKLTLHTLNKFFTHYQFSSMFRHTAHSIITVPCTPFLG